MTNIKMRIASILVALATIAGVGLVGAAPAAAAGYDRTCTAPGAWQFKSHVSTSGSTVISWSIGYVNPGWLGLEYRFRIWNQYGLIYDIGYQQVNANSVSGSPWFTMYGGGYHIQLDAGRWNDGLPTCAMHVYL